MLLNNLLERLGLGRRAGLGTGDKQIRPTFYKMSCTPLCFNSIISISISLLLWVLFSTDAY